MGVSVVSKPFHVPHVLHPSHRSAETEVEKERRHVKRGQRLAHAHCNRAFDPQKNMHRCRCVAVMRASVFHDCTYMRWGLGHTS